LSQRPQRVRTPARPALGAFRIFTILARFRLATIDRLECTTVTETTFGCNAAVAHQQREAGGDSHWRGISRDRKSHGHSRVPDQPDWASESAAFERWTTSTASPLKRNGHGGDASIALQNVKDAPICHSMIWSQHRAIYRRSNILTVAGGNAWQGK